MFALHLVRCEILQRHVKSVLHLASSQMVCCAVLLTIWASVDISLPSETGTASFTEILASIPWAVTIFTSVFCTACCQTGELVAVTKVEASTAALTLSMITVWGMAFGIMYKGASLSFTQCAGAACILASGVGSRLLTFFNQTRGRTTIVTRARAHVVSIA